MKTTWRNRREKSDRIEFLNGNWKFRFYESIYDLQEKFYEESYDTNGFGEIPVPGIWQNFGYDEHQYTNVRYPIPLDPPLGTLILNSERQLYSTAKTILINDQDCADAIQETIVKAFSKIGTLRNDKYAKTWLIRILINECYTLLRKSSKLVSLEGMSEMTEIETDQRTDYSDLYRAVNSLKEELRMPVILYYIEDFNIKEIAQIFEITEGAVQKRLARARGKLKRNLQESEELTV